MLQNVPTPLSSLIGREAEVAQVTHLLGTSRLLTLTGPGGVGKTRLALAAATSLTSTFADGVAFVSLAETNDPAHVTSDIVAALGLTPSGNQSPLDALVECLTERHMLLVLDNFEQVLPAAPMVNTLLQANPQLYVLVTSRIALRLSGEQEVPVLPLALPDDVDSTSIDQLLLSEAIQLFLQRSRAGNPSFGLTPGNASAVAAICRGLDGLPLAIELAAARTKALSPDDILARLDRSLALLKGGARDLPARQMTMRSAIAWSYDLLSADDQALFRRLSVFAGGWTLAAAQRVCMGTESTEDDFLDQMLGLVDKHLIHPRPPATSEREDAPRFGMLQTIREFGREQLAVHHETDDISQRHAAYMLEYVEPLVSEWDSDRHSIWLARGDAEIDNVRAALGWAVRHDAETALKLNTAFSIYWLQRAHFAEGRRWFDLGLASDAAVSDSARATALAYACYFATSLGNYAVAQELCEEALTMSQRIGDLVAQAESLFCLGRIAMFTGDQEQAYDFYSSALTLVREIGPVIWLPWLPNLLGNLAAVATERNDFAAAYLYATEALDISRELEDPGHLANSLSDIARVALAQSDIDRARAHLLESLTLQRSVRNPTVVAHTVEYCAWLAVHSQQPERTARLLGSAVAMRESIGVPVPPLVRRDYDTYVPLARARIDAVAWDRAWEVGHSSTPDEAIAYALELPREPEPDPVSAAPADSAAVDGLSRREIEVLRQVVDGRSNQEIAEALFISPHTAAKHVANIMNKLGVESRTAAATWAVRQGINPPDPSPPSGHE
jgi:predicted ATPase/DNA-binding CsgD family transcriptional regulator